MIAMSFMQFINCSLSNFGQPYQIKNKKISFSTAPKCTNDTNSRFFFFFSFFKVILYFSCPISCGKQLDTSFSSLSLLPQ